MKKIAILLCVFGIILSSNSYLFSQCTNTSSYGSATAPSDGTVVQISTCNYQTEYSTVSGFVAGQTYVAGYNLGGYITVRSGTYDGPVVASGNAPLTFNATVSGTLFIHYSTNAGCGTATDCGVSTIACTSCGGAVMTVPSTGNNSYTTCGGNLYDFGGSAGDYGISWDGYSVINPDVAGNMVQVTGTIAGESCCDYLYIYDGVGTGGTLLWSGVTSSGTVPVTTSTSGPLTIRFTSDGSIVGAGFNLILSCVASAGPCASVTAMTCGTVYSGTLAASGSDWNSYTDCAWGAGDEVVYSFTPTTTGVHTLTGNTTSGDPDFFLMSSCGNTGTNIIGGCWGGGTQTPTLTAGTTYYFIVDNYSSSSTAGYEISITCPVGGNCASVTPMVCGTIYSGNLLAQVGEWSGYTDCTWGAGDEVVYSFTPTTTGVHTLTGNTTSGDPDFFLMSSCGNTGTNIIGTCWGGGTQTPTLTAGTTYYFIVDNYSTTNTADYEISVTCPNPLSTNCPSSEPFCTSNAYTFPAGVNQPDMGHIGCLWSTPNPAWYWMEIDNPGDIIINISSGADVDFIAWGPYSDLPTACATIPISSCATCPNNTTDPSFYPFGEIVDCSYSGAAAETANILNAQSGDVYVLLLTNYANVATNISFVQASGSGSTNCGIVAPPVSNNGPLCVGQTLELYVSNPTAGATYAWTGPDGWTSNVMEPTRPNVTTAMAGVYSLVITVGGISSAPVTTTVDIYTYPTAGITNNTGSTVLTCTVTPINVTATGGGTYAWSGGTSTATAANSFTAPGAYTVTVTNVVCVDTESITITQNITPPTAAITNNTGTTILTCTTTAISVTATGGGTYAWSGGATPATAANSFNAAGTYTVTVTAANGCTDTEAITITQNITPPTAGITNNTGTTILTCTTTAISVTATGGGTYAWSGGATPATAANSFNAAGTYTVTVTAANGCTDTEAITITQNITPPTAGITNNTGTTILTCTTTAISVTATGGGTYAWSGGATPATAANSFNAAGTYTVTVTAANGCTDTEAITITQNITPPTAGITNNTGTTILTCTTTSISVTATGGGTYAWSGGATPATAANSFNAAGTYTVTVTAANGCTDTEAITITQNITPPTAGITNNTGTTILTCTTTSISVTATGGGTYAWSGGATPATAANSFNAAGTYTVTVTAANGCTDTEAITITQNITPPTAGITNNTGTTILTCTTLSISVTATGGGTYAWSGGATPATAANSFNAAGTYTVTVTAANGCTDTESITITQTVAPPTAGITNNTGSTVINCTVLSISVTATGGGTYAWSGGTTPATAANSFNAAGTYTVTVTAANGCTDTESITITQDNTPPTAAITNNTGTTILTCTTTSISVTATGGGTYAWSGGATPATAANSFNAAGTYTVTVTAANGCTDTESITITQNITPPTAGITNNTGTTVLTCATTAISVTATGGGTYAWSGGATPATAANSFTTPGTYTVTVTAANGCTDTETITITQNITPPTAGITNNTGTTILTCTTTAISVTATGGGTYAWSGGATPGTAANSLATPATYTVTVTAANGCTDTESITITQNITPPTAGITNNTGTTVLTCATTAISVTATGGGTYSWSGGATPATAANSFNAPGTYTVTVTAANGCTDTESITITQNITPPTAGITNNTGSTIITCTLLSIDVTATGGVTYIWSGGTSPNTANNLLTSAGAYTVTVTGANGCTATSSITLTDALTITASVTALTDQNCSTQGSATVQGASGIAPYSYVWPAGAGGVVGGTASSLAAGTYVVSVYDANMCSVTQSLTIIDIGGLTGSAAVSATPLCFGGNGGAIDVSVVGGTPNYDINWGTGSFSSPLANYTITGLTQGAYNITVTDVNSCQVVVSATVNQPTLLTASSSATPILCNGGNSTVTVSGAGGTAPYSGTGTFTVTAGTHNYTITDANGCTANTSVTISQPTLLSASSSATAIMCNGGNSTVTVSGAGGTAPYSGTGTFTVTAGTYNYTVSDVNGCTANTSVTITQPTAVTASVTAIAQQVCTVPGSATVQGANGTPPYTYTWPVTAGGVSGGSASALTVGSYTVSVYDANMCSVTQLVTITDIGGLTASAVMASQPSCFGGANGSASVTIGSGTAPYNIIWPSGSATAPASPHTITGLSQGTYIFTITDVNGCQANTSVNITQPTVLTASSSAASIMCNGGTTTVTVSGSGGTPAYSGVGTFTVPAGTYNYTVTDVNGCTANTSITVNQPTLLTASSTSGNILCNGGTTTVTVSGSGGTPAYSGIGTFTVPAGTYNYTITDINGCTANTSITVGQPTLLTANAVAGTILCNGGTTTVNVTASGGTPAYSGTGTFTVGVGTHNYVVTDINGCTANASVTIAQPAVLNASSTSTEILCNGGTSTVTVTATGGTGTYSGTGNFVESAGTNSYTVTDINGCQDVTTITINEPSWLTATATAGEILCFGGTTTMNIVANGGTPPYSGTGTFPVIAGNYNYTITDDNGCITFASETVNQPQQLVVSETVTNALCNGYDGSATVNIVSGGTLPCTILWEDGNTQFTNPNIPVNTNFEYTVTDDNGCQVIGDVNVTEPAALVLTMSSTNASCYGLCDGTATVSIAGGTAPYITGWQPIGAGSTNISNLCAGTYFVTVSDDNGCTASAQVIITQPDMLQVVVASSPAQCGAAGGSAFASIAGGTDPYTITWSVPQITNPAIGLAPGNYTCYVSDGWDCTASADFTIGITDTINAAINLVQPVSCNGDSNGSLQAVSSNGVSPLYFAWSNDWHSATLSNLPAAQYSVIITDSWGCEGNASFNLPEPQAMVINSNITDVSCFGLSDGSIALAVLHGTSPYSYSWNVSGNSNLITDLPAGTYDVVVTDFGECTASGSYTVSQPDELLMTTSVNNISCYGYLDGAVLISAIGGSEPYTFRIFDGTTFATGASFNNLSGGIYTVSAEDDNGCSKSTEVMILEPSEIQGSYIAHNPSCIGNNDGLIEISIMGGTAPYLFGWDGNFIDIPFISGLRDGDYDVVVTDANNCVFSFGNIIMNEEEVDCLRIPNAFTPNGDGPNDTWIIENLEIFPGAYVFVYNRWGQEIWVGRPGDEWDGNFNGKQVPTGTYLYVINLYNGTPPYTGTVTIVE